MLLITSAPEPAGQNVLEGGETVRAVLDIHIASSQVCQDVGVNRPGQPYHALKRSKAMPKQAKQGRKKNKPER